MFDWDAINRAEELKLYTSCELAFAEESEFSEVIIPVKQKVDEAFAKYPFDCLRAGGDHLKELGASAKAVSGQCLQIYKELCKTRQIQKQ